MDKFYKRVELTANIAIIVLALVLGVVFVKRFAFKSEVVTQGTAPETALRGQKISLPSMDWSQSPRHLVLVLQKGCHFCSESASFYQRLIPAVAKHSDMQLVAALPQSVSESKQYLNDLGVSINEVRQADLSSIGVRGTPTLLLVDRNGVVTDLWIGKLPPEKEQEVLSHL
jgi:thioredoxin-related protein